MSLWLASISTIFRLRSELGEPLNLPLSSISQPLKNGLEGDGLLQLLWLRYGVGEEGFEERPQPFTDNVFPLAAACVLYQGLVRIRERWRGEGAGRGM